VWLLQHGGGQWG
jgi:hypothetical protein